MTGATDKFNGPADSAVLRSESLGDRASSAGHQYAAVRKQTTEGWW